MRQLWTKTLFALTCGLGLALILVLTLWASSTAPTYADDGTRYVDDASGVDGGDCQNSGNPCKTVQYAVEQASTGDEIRVAQGLYTGVSATSGFTQVLYISKTLTVRGGYTTTDGFTASFPLTQPTTLDAQGLGRVLYITGTIHPTVEGLRLTGGDASQAGSYDAGGGVFLDSSFATLNGNVIISNTAEYGGGVILLYGSATLQENTIIYNTAWYGGGVGMGGSDATLNKNTIISNTAYYYGGGVYLGESPATLGGNTITSNSAAVGGGVYLSLSPATLNGNTIISNSTDSGGGLYLGYSDATLSRNTIASNSAHNNGGGVYLYRSPATLTNNLIADNQAGRNGSGVYVAASAPRLIHTTLARNIATGGGKGSGIYITDYSGTYSTVVLTNTLLVSHAVGITITSGNTTTLDGVLWGGSVWANDKNWSGNVTVTHEITGNPAFLSPDAGDYHIRPESDAIDNGVDTSIHGDIDGDPRPADMGFDLGADEYQGVGLRLHKTAAPIALNLGQTVTYTLLITNVGVNPASDVCLTEDLVGHPLADALVEWSFSTTSPPTVTAFGPPHKAQDVALDAAVVITFSETISANTLAYSLTPDPGGWAAEWSGGGTVVTLGHDPFAYWTSYTVSLSAAADLVGNPLSGTPLVWSFVSVPRRVYLPLIIKVE